MSVRESQDIRILSEGSKSRELELRTQLLVMFILVALLPGFLISGIFLILRLSGGAGSLADISGVGMSVIIVVVSVVVAAGAALVMAHEIARRVNRITRTVNAAVLGRGNVRLPIDQDDAIGQLAAALNRLIERLPPKEAGLEQAAAVPATDLVRRAARLETTMLAVQEAAAARDIDRMMSTVVDQVVSQFRVDHVGIYLLDETRRFLSLRASAASDTAQPLARGLRVAVDSGSSVAAVVATGEGLVVRHDGRWDLDPANRPAEKVAGEVSQEPPRGRSEILPETRSELSLPLRVRGRLVGVLDIQSAPPRFGATEMASTEVRALIDAALGGDPLRDPTSAVDILHLQVVADQIGFVLESTQLLEEAQQRFSEIVRLVQSEREEGWRALLLDRQRWAYLYDGVEVRPVDDDMPVVEKPDLMLSLGSADRQLGNIAIKVPEGETLTPDAVDLAREVAAEASQALERARLFQSSQDALGEAEMLYRCSQAVVAARSPDDVLRAIAEAFAVSDGIPQGGIDRGLLLVRETIGSRDRLRVRSVLAENEDLDGFVDQGWSRDRLPILDHEALRRPPAEGIVHFERLIGDDHLDAVSQETLGSDIGLRAALILRLDTRLGPTQPDDGSLDGGSAGGEGASARDVGPVGWLVMGSTKGAHQFSDKEVRLYLGISDLVGTVLRNFQLLELARERARRAQLVGSISTRVRETLDMDLVLQTALREIGENLGVSSIEVQMQRAGAGRDISAGSSPMGSEASDTPSVDEGSAETVSEL